MHRCLGEAWSQISNVVSLNREGVTLPLINFLKEEFNLSNTGYIIKKKSGKSTWNTERYIRLVQENSNSVSIPRGAVGKLLRFCRKNAIDYELNDKRKGFILWRDLLEEKLY